MRLRTREAATIASLAIAMALVYAWLCPRPLFVRATESDVALSFRDPNRALYPSTFGEQAHPTYDYVSIGSRGYKVLQKINNRVPELIVRRHSSEAAISLPANLVPA